MAHSYFPYHKKKSDSKCTGLLETPHPFSRKSRKACLTWGTLKKENEKSSSVSGSELASASHIKKSDLKCTGLPEWPHAFLWKCLTWGTFTKKSKKLVKKLDSTSGSWLTQAFHITKIYFFS